MVCAIAISHTFASADERNEAIFENHIRPVLVETCFVCHGGPKISGKLKVDSRDALLTGGESGPAIVVGSPESSLLMKAIRRHEDVSAMPPDVKQKLTSVQVSAFEAWIQSGAHWPANYPKFESKKHWAFEPIRTVEPPWDLRNGDNPVDTFIRSKQQLRGIEHASRADKFTLIRRATFDLTGLPPTPEEVSAFEQDATTSAFENVVNRLLESVEYGRRWGRHWLDVVRYADTAGETADYPVPLAWRYRNYVIDSFNSDKPYDQFLQEQLAGDVLAVLPPTNLDEISARSRYAEKIIATGYLAMSRRFGFDSENYHHLTIQDTIDNLGQAMLGLSIGCARCHDHKFDAVSMVDYYGLYAIFDSTRYSFPGSEQKQKVRSLAPLIPPADALLQWRKFDQRVASLAASLEKRKQPVPSAILRSLNDMDGDFELQAPAAGGSNGVLVPPWLYDGKIAVSNAAQSPFKNVYARGKVGASISTDAGAYRIAQALYPHRTNANCKSLNINLDFRITANSNASGAHHFWLGSRRGNRVFQVSIAARTLSVQSGDKTIVTTDFAQNEWHNLQLNLDFIDGTIRGSLATTATNKIFAPWDSLNKWSGSMDQVVFESVTDEGAAPAIEFDNICVQEGVLASATVDLACDNCSKESIDDADLTQQWNELTGADCEFEFQKVGAAPEKPWNAGPNSVVKISANSQSSFGDLFPLGTHGVFMPNRAEYDGFGLTLPKTWTSLANERLYATVDFRLADAAAGGDGSWRYYLGHGPGSSAAVELFWNDNQFLKRSRDAKELVHSLKVGEWYRVQLVLDLKAKTYEGNIASTTGKQVFSGKFASGWDGSIDYSFIDSYGHIGGTRPALNVDNYAIRETAFLPVDVNSTAHELAVRREKAVAIKQRIADQQAALAKAKSELDSLLVDGPFEMAYGVSEGTPHNVRVHMRGEPERLGQEVPRGFIQVLGDAAFPDEVKGSGRLELARWITRPSNPLTARVMVNRIWQNHFGTGLVKTPNDFGVRGLPPTHPELLEFLATEFIRSGWSVKAMHRLIMKSETYQQSSSRKQSPASEIDTLDFYTYYQRRRLTAEEIRDSILAVSGVLDRESANGHPFPSPIQWGFTQHSPFSAVYENDKRSVYLMTQRLKRHPYLALFDGADPNSTTAVRLGTTVPTQALFFLNDPFIHAKSDAWARRLIRNFSATNSRIQSAYNAAFAREPTNDEQSDAFDFLKTYQAEFATLATENQEAASLAALLRTLIASNEFLHVE